MGKKLKVRTFNFPNWIKNLDQILYNILFMAKSIYNNRGQSSFHLSSRLKITVKIMTAQSTTTKMPSRSPNGIHKGAVTHHHDQSITLVSLSTRNVRNRRFRKLVPPTATLDVFVSLICVVSLFGLV